MSTLCLHYYVLERDMLNIKFWKIIRYLLLCLYSILIRPQARCNKNFWTILIKRYYHFIRLILDANCFKRASSFYSITIIWNKTHRSPTQEAYEIVKQGLVTLHQPTDYKLHSILGFYRHFRHIISPADMTYWCSF